MATIARSTLPGMVVNTSKFNAPCLVCGGHEFRGVFSGRAVNNHILAKCAACEMVQAFVTQEVPPFDYSGYGDYLLLSDSEIARRVRYVSKGMRAAFDE